MNEQELLRFGLLNAVKKNNVMPVTELEKHLFKDEAGDVFLITKKAEIYLSKGYNAASIKNAELGLYVWGQLMRSQLQKEGLILREMSSDEDFYIMYSNIRNLPRILSLGGTFKKRPHLRGTFISRLQKRLGHKILPFNPSLAKVE